MATPAGAFLYATLDRICEGLVFGGRVVDCSGTAGAPAAGWPPFMVRCGRSRGEALGVTGRTGVTPPRPAARAFRRCSTP